MRALPQQFGEVHVAPKNIFVDPSSSGNNQPARVFVKQLHAGRSKTIIEVTRQSFECFSFWYKSNGIAKLLQGNSDHARRQEKQKDRDDKFSRLQIFPSDVAIDVSDQLRFTAVAYDAEGRTVGGVKIKWRGQGAAPNHKVRISQQGEFEAMAPGTFTITAQANGKSAQTTVTVRPGLTRNLNAPTISTREVSSRERPKNKIASTRADNNPNDPTARSIAKVNNRLTAASKRAHAVKRVTVEPDPIPQGGGGGWDSTNYWSADDPENRVGDPPGGSPDGGAGSGNFRFAAPVLSLPGRGINISLGLAYNSRVWNKAGTQLSYDNDRGWPSPGFNLGFGKMLGMGVYNGAMLVDADGTRHSYTGAITFYSWGAHAVLHTTDGSFIDYEYWSGAGGSLTQGQAKLPNGTTITFGASSGHLYPTSIEDANGNYITITYVNNVGPRIQVINDTLNRTINFHYDSNNLLTAVTAPGYNGGSARTVVRMHYQQLNLAQYSNYGFSSSVSAVANNPYPWVIDSIYYPATSTGYWLHDFYSSYGMLAKVKEERNMSFSGSGLTDMGLVYEGSVTRSEEYSYPVTPDYGLTDAPTYGTMTEKWTPDGGTTLSEAVTQYDVHENDSPRTTTITLSNGTKTKQYAFNNPGQYNDGLVFQDVTFVTTESNPLQSSHSYWAQGAYDSPRPTRIEKTDERGQMTAAEFSYGSVYNQVTEVRDYDYGGSTLLRSTHSTYQNNTNYTGTCYSYGCVGRHIFNLPLTIELYAGDNVTRVARTEYQYDGQTLSATPNVVQHDQAFNPHADEEGFCYMQPDWGDPDCYGGCELEPSGCDNVCDEVPFCPYDSSTDYRGNVTQTTSYTDAATATGAVTETRRYDVTGNLVKTSTACCDQTTLNYTIDTQFAYPESQTRGSATDWHAQVTTTATSDFNTGLGKSATDANGRPSTTNYDPTTLRPTSIISPTGAHTDYSYNDLNMTVSAITYLAPGYPDYGAIADQNIKYLNGRGQVRIEKVRGPDSGGETWDELDTTYDNFGQIYQQSKPYRAGVESPITSQVGYDALGRVISVTSPDGSMAETFYNESSRPDVASTSPGETTRVRDAWGRERWGRTDASGRLVEVVEPNPYGNGSVATGGVVTTYSYNTLGKLIQINQGAQTRTFKYDSLGRLTARKLAEINATLNDTGTYVGSGTWSGVFTYDERSNLTSSTDARGVKTVFNYNSDPLNRLQTVSWDTSGFGDSGNPILPAATVSYQYRTKANEYDVKDVTQLETVSTTGVSTEGYSYDTEGRVSSNVLTLASRTSYPFATDYTYDSLDRVKNVTYPTQYGNSGSRKIVHHDYDLAGRLNGLTYDSQSFASNIVYNAASQTTSLKVGSGTNQVTENYSYNAQTGLLESQTAARNGTTLLNLSYDYTNSAGKRTGQLLKISNNLDHTKDRGYEYDALGRLQRASGGQNVNWVQRYQYDRYGNRWNVFSYTAAQYVTNLYYTTKASQPSQSWVDSKVCTLQSKYGEGQSAFLDAMQDVAEELFTSSDYTNRNQNNHDYVHDLYQAYLFREPDSGGWAAWENALNNGASREDVRAGFAASSEFQMKVNATSAYPHPNGVVTTDGLQGLEFNLSSNRINVAGFEYDAAGNQMKITRIGGVVEKFQYDAANRLVNVKDGNNTLLASYSYGSTNERLIAEEFGQQTSVRTYYVAPLAEYTETGGGTTPAWTKSYVYLGDRLLSTLTPNGSNGEANEFDHPDRLGTRLVTNPSNGNSFEQVTLPFGAGLAAETTGQTKQRFTSYDRSDATGLDYAVNRHYDPQQGRFTQVDPGEMGATSLISPQSLNLYAYCGNDPINRTDADGLGLISALKRAFKKILHALIYAVIQAVITFVLTGGNLGAALAAGVAAFVSDLGWQSKGFWHSQRGTPPIFATAGVTLTQLSQGTILSTLFRDARPTPGWNPSGSTGIGPVSAFIDDCPDCVDVGGCGSAGNPCSLFMGTAKAFSSYARYLIWFRNFLAGIIDNGVGPPPIFGWTLGGVIRLGADRIAGNFADERSWAYFTGSLVPEIVAFYAGGAATAEAATGLSSTFYRYPKAKGGGINYLFKGERQFALDWHLLGKPPNQKMTLHWHWGQTRKAMKIHRGFFTGKPL